MFRKQMEDLHYIREDMFEMDEIAEFLGQEPPRKGDGKGRSRQDRDRTEGYCDRVSVPGSKPETPMTNQPKYVQERNEVRQGEVALRRGEKPPPGVGAAGFGQRGKKKGFGKAEAADG